MELSGDEAEALGRPCCCCNGGWSAGEGRSASSLAIRSRSVFATSRNCGHGRLVHGPSEYASLGRVAARCRVKVM